MRHSVSPLDDSLLGGEPGSYSRCWKIIGGVSTACVTLWHGAKAAFSIGKRTAELVSEHGESRKDILRLDIKLDELTDRQERTEQAHHVLDNRTVRMEESLKHITKMTEAMLRTNNTPIPQMRTPSQDEAAQLYPWHTRKDQQ